MKAGHSLLTLSAIARLDSNVFAHDRSVSMRFLAASGVAGLGGRRPRGRPVLLLRTIARTATREKAAARNVGQATQWLRIRSDPLTQMLSVTPSHE